MIRHKLMGLLLALCLPAFAMADLRSYIQDFESLVQSDPNALANDGWLVFGNVFDPTGNNFQYGYGPFPAPNGGPAFSGIDVGQGGPMQGAQQLVVYNDYNNGDHNNGNRIEANVFQEQTSGAVDVGKPFFFTFDAKLGNLGGATTALAFIKTLDPNNNFNLTNFITQDTTTTPTTWSTYQLSINIDNSLVGQILQVGFANTAANFDDSGVFYDNINFSVPEPGTAGLIAMGMCGLVLRRRRS